MYCFIVANCLGHAHTIEHLNSQREFALAALCAAENKLKEAEAMPLEAVKAKQVDRPGDKSAQVLYFFVRIVFF